MHSRDDASDFQYVVSTALPIGWDWSVSVTYIGKRVDRSGWALTKRRAWRQVDEAVIQCRRLLRG